MNNNNKSKDEFGALFDERCVRWLDYIIQRTDCKIVLSSTWRKAGLWEIQRMWDLRELPGEVIAITPLFIEPQMYEQLGFESQIRGVEIKHWLDNNKWDTYCIVDDNTDMLPDQNFVKTDKEIGLNFDTSHKIIKILNNGHTTNN